MPQADREEVRLTVRLPAALHAALTEAAAAERRSLNAEIVLRLERSLAEESESDRRRP